MPYKQPLFSAGTPFLAAMSTEEVLQAPSGVSFWACIPECCLAVWCQQVHWARHCVLATLT